MEDSFTDEMLNCFAAGYVRVISDVKALIYQLARSCVKLGICSFNTEGSTMAVVAKALQMLCKVYVGLWNLSTEVIHPQTLGVFWDSVSIRESRI